jgi:hypothetical protein
MSSKIDRLTVSRGPAMVTHRAGYFFTREDLVVDFGIETKPIQSAAFGELDQISQGVKASAKFRPHGEFEHLGVLWPYGTTPLGRSIFGEADYPLLIQPLDDTQKQTRFKAAAISKMPDLFLGASDTLLGDTEFQMVGANNVAVDDAERLFVLEDNAIDLDALPYNPDAVIVQAYKNRWLSAGTWLPSYNGVAATGGALAIDANAAAVQAKLRTIAGGIVDDVTVAGNYSDGFTVTDPDDDITAGLFTAVLAGTPGGSALKATQVSARVVKLELAPWAQFDTREGMKVAFALTLSEDTADSIGHYDTAFSGLTVTASGLPQGLTEAQMLAAANLQGANAVRGRKLSTGGQNLDIYGDGVFFRLYGANLRKAGQVFSATKQRIPDLEWVATRAVGAGGALNPLFYIGAVAPA